MSRTCRDGRGALVVVRLRGAGDVPLGDHAAIGGARGWTVALTSADWSDGGSRPAVEDADLGPVIRFDQPAAVVLTETR